MSTRPAALAVSLTGRPSTAISSPTVARSPSLAARPPTVTRPASIQDSISRREPRPAAASSFWSRSAFGAGGGVQRRPARRFAVADDVDPATGFERLHDLGRDHDAADVLDVATGHRLA